MRAVRGLLLSSLWVPVTCFTPPAFCSWKASHWPRRPPTSTAEVHPGLDVPAFRIRGATTVASRTCKAQQVKLRSSALDEPHADSTATATHASVFGDDSSAASTVPEDGRPPSTSSSSAMGGIQRSIQPVASSASLLPLALLNTVTLLWGTQHAVIKLVLQEDLSPGVTNFARFGIAALLFSPWTPGVLRDPPSIPFSSTSIINNNDSGEDDDVSEASAFLSREEDTDGDGDGGGGDGGGSAAETWRAGAELGLWMFTGFAFQSIGLGYTTASRSAFLLYLNVKLVPFFAFILEGRSISKATWISAFLAFAGTVLLSSDGTPPNVGDLWSVLAAATSAMFILRLEKYSGSCNASRLNSANLWITAGLCGVWAAWEVTTRGVDPSAAFEGVQAQSGLILYLAVVTTALTNWMQALGQRSVPAERAAVIYAMDPVYAAGFAYLLLGESLGPAGIAGAGIITGAALWNQGQQASGGKVETASDGVGTIDVEEGAVDPAQ